MSGELQSNAASAVAKNASRARAEARVHDQRHDPGAAPAGVLQ